MNRTIVIGDVQGCKGDLVRLLNECKVTANDRVILAGDIVDRGPDSAGCVEYAMHREQVQGSCAAILGNHDDRHIFYEDELNRTGRLPSMPHTHEATRRQLNQEHYDYMRSLPLFIRLPEHDAVVVHAGVYPGYPIEEQSRRHLLHIQMIRPYNDDGTPTHDMRSVWPSKVPPGEAGWKFWTNFWDGPERIIFGHSVFDVPLITDKVAGIDGGVCFGLSLHALVLPDWRIVTVHALNDHGPGRRGKVSAYKVHGDVKTFS